MNNGELAVLIQFFESNHAGIPAKMIVDFQNFVWLYTERGAMFVIGIVSIRHKGIEAVITAGQFHHNQDTIFARLVSRHRRSDLTQCQRHAQHPRAV